MAVQEAVGDQVKGDTRCSVRVVLHHASIKYSLILNAAY